MISVYPATYSSKKIKNRQFYRFVCPVCGFESDSADYCPVCESIFNYHSMMIIDNHGHY